MKKPLQQRVRTSLPASIELKLMVNDRITKLAMVSMVFFLLLNFPLLTIFDKQSMIWGVPALFFYLFAVWVIMIAFVFWIVRHRKEK